MLRDWSFEWAEVTELTLGAQEPRGSAADPTSHLELSEAELKWGAISFSLIPSWFHQAFGRCAAGRGNFVGVCCSKTEIVCSSCFPRLVVLFDNVAQFNL